MNTDDPLLAGLNPQQRQAVLHGEGPLLIFAGAGSGKTRVLTHRIAYLVDRLGVEPHRILAVTFTNKAAGEMAERVERLLGGRGRAVWVSTFHSFGVRVLRRDAARLGYAPGFSIYDDTDQRALIKDLMRRRDVDPELLDPRNIMTMLDQAKNAMQDPVVLAGQMRGPLADACVDVVTAYAKELRANNAMDFGDLLVKTVELFTQHPDVREHYRTRFHHLLVDEFQDTNTVQNRLLTLLLGDRQNLCVVGDDDQSIYRWRGAKIENILNFERAFPDATKIVLGQNYRSTATIVAAADAVIRHNAGRAPKRLFTANDPGTRIRLFRADDEYDEARFIGSSIRDLALEKGVPLSGMAVFYRTNALSRVIEEELSRLGVPFIVVGGTRFYDRKEIKDILAYLRLVVNPDDAVSAKRIINVPARKIGKTTVEKIEAHAADTGLHFLAAIHNLVETGGLPKGATDAVKGFLEIVADLHRAAHERDLADLVGYTMQRSGYKQMLADDRSVESLSRQENLGELLEAVSQFHERNPELGLRDYLEQVSLSQDADLVDDTGESVRLMTLHNAKGLEFPAVFLIGAEEAILPHARSLAAGLAEIEEERRLCYVGITRARRHLTITCAARRRSYSGQASYARPSRFLDEIPGELIEAVGLVTPQIASSSLSRPSASGGHSAPTIVRRPGASGSSRPPASLTRPLRPVPAPVAAGDSYVDYGESQDHETAMRPGARVMHAQFGAGVVMALNGSGDKTRVVVRFSSVGVKTLMLSHARLEIR